MNRENQKVFAVIGIEIVIALVLLVITIFHGRKLGTIDVDLNAFSSDIMNHTGDEWSITGESDGLDKDVSIIDSGNISLPAGSYTLIAEYEADNQLKGKLSSGEKRVFLHSGIFNFNRNKTKISCDFYLTQAIDDIKLSVSDYPGGRFVLKKVSVAENNNNYRILLFTWLFISAIADVFLFSSFYRNNKRLINVMLMIAFMASIPAFMYGFGLGHDTGFHLVRIEGIAEGLKQGEFPVKMNSVFDDSYGYPVDVFYPNMLLYLPAILRVIGFSITTAYKSYIVFINIITVITSYFLFKEVLSDKKIVIIASAAYACSSYRLENLWVRQALGEYTAMAFLPLIALGMWRIYTLDVKDKSYKYGSGILAFGMLGLLYSHVLSTEMAAIVLTIIALVFFKKTFQLKRLLELVKAVGIFVLLGFAFIMPFLDYFMNTNNAISAGGEDIHYIQERGVYINDYFAFFRNVFGFDSIHSANRMLLTPGFILMLALLIGIFMWIIGKADEKIKFTTASSCMILFVSLSFFPWNQLASKLTIFNMIASMEFPWRFIGFATLFLAALLGFILEAAAKNGFEIDKTVAATGVGLVLVVGSFVSLYSQGILQTYYIDTAEIPTYTGGKVSAVNGVEYLLRGTDIERLDYNVIAENGTARIASENGVDMVLEVEMQGQGSVLIPRFAYPYYDVIDDNGNVLSTDNGDNNKMLIYVPENYKGNITVDFCIPRKWRIYELVSLFSLIGYIFMIVFQRRRNDKRYI